MYFDVVLLWNDWELVFRGTDHEPKTERPRTAAVLFCVGQGSQDGQGSQRKTGTALQPLPPDAVVKRDGSVYVVIAPHSRKCAKSLQMIRSALLF